MCVRVERGWGKKLASWFLPPEEERRKKGETVFDLVSPSANSSSSSSSKNKIGSRDFERRVRKEEKYHSPRESRRKERQKLISSPCSHHLSPSNFLVFFQRVYLEETKLLIRPFDCV